MAGFARRNTLAGWWSVYHHSTDHLMIGTLTHPTRAITAPADSPFSSSSNEMTRAQYPRYKKSKRSMDVRRASQTHQAPQVGFPQIAPVPKLMRVKARPIGAMDLVITGGRGERVTKPQPLSIAMLV